MQFFLLAAILSQLLAFFIGTLYLKHYSSAFKIMYYQVMFALICEGTGYYITTVLHQTNLWVFNIYMFVEIMLIGSVGVILANGKTLRNVIKLLLIIIAFYWLYLIEKNSIYTLANQAYLFASILFVAMYLFVIFRHIIFTTRTLHSNATFWLCLSIVIYFACYIPYKGIENGVLFEDTNIARNLFRINLSLNIIRYTIIAAAFYLYARQAKRGYVQQ